MTKPIRRKRCIRSSAYRCGHGSFRPHLYVNLSIYLPLRQMVWTTMASKEGITPVPIQRPLKRISYSAAVCHQNHCEARIGVIQPNGAPLYRPACSIVTACQLALTDCPSELCWPVAIAGAPWLPRILLRTVLARRWPGAPRCRKTSSRSVGAA